MNCRLVCCVAVWALVVLAAARTYGQTPAPTEKTPALTCFKRLGKSAKVSGPAINDRGDVAFVVSGGSVSEDNGVWLALSGESAERLIALDKLPGWPPGVEGFTCENMLFNEQGVIAIVAYGSKERTTIRGMWYIDTQRKVHRLLVGTESVASIPKPVVVAPFFNLIGLSDQQPGQLWCVVNEAAKRKTNGAQPPAKRFVCRFSPEGGLIHASFLNDQERFHYQVNGRGDLLQYGREREFVYAGEVGIPVDALYGPVDPVNPRGMMNDWTVFNNQRRIAYWTHASQNDSVIAAADPIRGTRRILDDSIAGHAIGHGFRMAMNNLGNVVVYTPHSRSYAALYFCPVDADYAFKIVASQETIAPGTNHYFYPAQLVTLPFKPNPTTFQKVSLNDRNQILFIGSVHGDGIDFTNNVGAWIADTKTDDTELIAMMGRPLVLGEGDSRIITSIDMGAETYLHPNVRSLNNRGQLALRCTFKDGTAAVLVCNSFATPGEPTEALVDRNRLEEARSALNEWTVLADQEINRRKAFNANSEWTKLQPTASSLRVEFARLTSEVTRFRSNDTLPLLVRNAQIEYRERRKNQLRLIWAELGRWPFNVAKPERGLAEQTYFRALNGIQVKYGDIEEISQAMSSKSLEVDKHRALVPDTVPIPERPVGSDRRLGIGMFGSYRHGRTGLKMFSQPLDAATPLAALEWPSDLDGGHPQAAAPIDTVRPLLRQFVRLTLMNDGRLSRVPGYWELRHQRPVYQNSFLATYRLLRDAGLSARTILRPELEHLTQAMLAPSVPPEKDTIINALFSQLRASFPNAQGSINFTNGHGYLERRFLLSNVMMATLRVDAKSSELVLHELNDVDVRRSLSIRTTNQQFIRIHMESENEQFTFRQLQDGRIRVFVSDDHADVAPRAKTFGELYRDSAEFVENRLLHHFRAIGITGPVSRYDSRFVELLPKLLRARFPADHAKFIALKVELDADRFAVRTQAFNELAAGAIAFRALASAALKDELSLETRSRLEQIVELADQDLGEYRNLYTALGTLDSKEQLASLRPLMSPDGQAIVDAHIEELNSSE